MSNSGTPRWLEAELSRHLGPAEAPGSLWDRIQRPRELRRAQALPWARWAVAAILTVSVAAGMFWLPGRARGPKLRLETVAAGTSHPARRANHLPEWDLSCAPPASHSTYQLAALSTSTASLGCQHCHAMAN